jgi:hypothetical protein
MQRGDDSVPSVRYTAFLRSGSYPAVSALLSRRGEWSRYAGLAALAAVASSAGYMTTQRLVPMNRAELHAGVASLAPQLKPVPRASLPSAVAKVEPVIVSELPPKKTPRTGAIARREAVRRPAPQLTAASDAPARAVQASEPPRPIPDNAQAERARAGEEARRAEAAAPLPAAERARAGEEAGRAEVAAPRPAAVRAPQPQKTLDAHPQAANLWPLMAATTVDGLRVKGPLGVATVRRGIERLRPALASCYADMAKRAGHNHFGRVDVSLVIDETGRVRSPHVAGGLLPGLDACLAGVASKLVTSAPDTGTATASLVLSFTP